MPETAGGYNPEQGFDWAKTAKENQGSDIGKHAEIVASRIENEQAIMNEVDQAAQDMKLEQITEMAGQVAKDLADAKDELDRSPEDQALKEKYTVLSVKNLRLSEIIEDPRILRRAA